jgi:hypothetical protein
MAAYADKPGVIVAEVDSSTNRQAADEIMSLSSFPTFAELIRGNCTILSIKRDFQSYVDHAEGMRKSRIEESCDIWQNFARHRYPGYVFATKSGDRDSCKAIRSICDKVGIGPDKCFLDRDSSTKPTVTIHYTETFNLTVTAETTAGLASLVWDFSRDPFGDWDMSTIRKSTRRAVVLIYGFTYQIMDAKKVSPKYTRDLLMGRLSMDDFHARAPQIPLAETDTPAYVFSDKNRRKFTILKAAGRKQELRSELDGLLRGEYDSRMKYRMSLIANGGKSDYYWVFGGIAGLIVLICLGGGLIWRKSGSKRE